MTRTNFVLTGFILALMMFFVVWGAFSIPATFGTILGVASFVGIFAVRLTLIWLGIQAALWSFAAWADRPVWNDILDDHEEWIEAKQQRKRDRKESRKQKVEALTHQQQEVLNVSGLQERWKERV